MNRYLLVLLLLFATQASAQLYRWVDEKGRVNYGEKPPPGVQKREVQDTRSEPPPAHAPSSGPKGHVPGKNIVSGRAGDPAAEAREKKAREEKRLREARARDERKPGCEAAQENLKYAERNKLYHEKKGSKQPVIFTNEEQLTEIHKRRAQMNRNCF